MKKTVNSSGLFSLPKILTSPPALALDKSDSDKWPSLPIMSFPTTPKFGEDKPEADFAVSPRPSEYLPEEQRDKPIMSFPTTPKFGEDKPEADFVVSPRPSEYLPEEQKDKPIMSFPTTPKFGEDISQANLPILQKLSEWIAIEQKENVCSIPATPKCENNIAEPTFDQCLPERQKISKSPRPEAAALDLKTVANKLENEATFIKVKGNKKDIPSLILLSQGFFNCKEVCFEHNPGPEERKQRYWHGGSSIVKKVFPLLSSSLDLDSKNSETPLGVVKILTEKVFFLKEIKYHQLLERHILFAQRNQKFYIFMPFYKISLSVYNTQLKKFYQKGLSMEHPLFTPLQRLNFFIGYLQQVKVIHDRKECVGDPKSTNCMLDWDEKSMKNPTLNMIDFDGVHIKGSQEKWLHTRICLPPNLINQSSRKIRQEYDLPDDIFILGHMLAECFPEFFNIKFHNPPQNFKGLRMAAKLERVASKPRAAEELEFDNKLHGIIRSMMNENPSLRSNIGYCIGHLSDLNPVIKRSSDSSDDDNRSLKRRKL